MRQTVLSLLAFLSIAATYAGSQRFCNDELEASIIEPGVTVIETADKTTMYLVEGDSAAILIDTGTKCSDLDKIIAGLTNLPLKVVATHNHPDHVGNIKYFPEIYIHPADTALSYPQLREYNGIINFINHGDRLCLGGRELEVIHTPGHTPGSICLVDYAAGLAFTGDALGSGQLWMQLKPQIPFATLAESCGRMIELMTEKGINKLYVGHYPYLKKPLGSDYMLDIAVATRRIDAGDTNTAKDFGNDGAKLIEQGSAQIVFRPESAGQHTIKRPTVLLKLDDVHYGEGNDAVPPRWNKVLGYLRNKGIDANFGIIGYSLAADRPDYIQWLKDVAKEGDIEFWNHGYNNRMSLEEPGEFELDYDTQYRALHLTDSLATARAGLKLQAWGRHWTNCNEHTDKALSTIDGLRLIFGNPKKTEHFKGIIVPLNLEMEYPFHNPVYKLFLANYLGKWRNLDSFYLQGHPNSWDENRWHEFEQIIDRLLADRAEFVTITKYLQRQSSDI